LEDVAVRKRVWWWDENVRKNVWKLALETHGPINTPRANLIYVIAAEPISERHLSAFFVDGK
jgi:hypothetical protein